MKSKDMSSTPNMLKYLDLLKEEFDKRNISYIVEMNTDIHIWFDKESNFGCCIYGMGLDISHLDGSVTFNLDEGWEVDISNIPYIIEHVTKIMTGELCQIETYKLKKLCSVNQELVIENKRFSCSSLAIKYILFFIPFVRKQVLEKHYSYSETLKKLRFNSIN